MVLVGANKQEMEESCPFPIHVIYLLAFGLPYIPSPNDKCRIVGSSSNTPAVILFLQSVEK